MDKQRLLAQFREKYKSYHDPDGDLGLIKHEGLEEWLSQAFDNIEKDKEKLKNLEAQVDRLANFIIFNIPGEPSQSEGAVDTAIRLLAKYQIMKDKLGQQR